MLWGGTGDRLTRSGGMPGVDWDALGVHLGLIRVLWGALGIDWGALGGHWESTETLWAPTGTLWEPTADRLGRAGGALGLDWDALGAHWEWTGPLWEPLVRRMARSGGLMGVDWGTLAAHWDMDRFSDCNMLIRFTLLLRSALLNRDLGACLEAIGGTNFANLANLAHRGASSIYART